ncbi:NERD domain-containing protein [Alkalihalobacterium elongatum]|uniref:NERD domain-containing protein n=1 Tax=Alkalihalobacterium elongatum TaxID=2675466 RepID=UPI0038B25DC0
MELFFAPVLILAIILYAIFKPQIKGYLGERTIATFLSQLDRDKYTVINDVVLNVAGKTSQIDHVIVSNYGIFVIETKNYKGWIFGDEKSQYWTQVIYKRKERFYNPLRQNYGHIKALENALINFGQLTYIPIVVFSVNATLKVNVTSDVVYSVNLLKTIRKYDEETLSNYQKQQITNQLNALNNNKDRALKKEHVKMIKDTQKTIQHQVQNNICPKCGSALVERMGKAGSFKGCSSFPKCRFTASA